MDKGSFSADIICIKKRREFKIAGISIYELITYFIIYSIFGFLLETIVGIATKGVIESRRSFLYGPFCAVYGLGAICAIICLYKYRVKKLLVFLGGLFLGTFIEYIVSLIGEIIYHVKWWDYSSMLFNIDGRICLLLSICWGLISLILIEYIHPKVINLVNRFSKNSIKLFSIVISLLLIVDGIIGALGMKIFVSRLAINYDIAISSDSYKLFNEASLQDNKFIKNLSDNYFTNERMLKAFPNLKIIAKDGKIIFIRDIFDDINPYYLRVFKVNR